MAGEFEERLERHEQERHRGIGWRLPRRRAVVEMGCDGFVEPITAAGLMHVTEPELWAMVARGQVAARNADGQVLVRPAVVKIVQTRS